MPRDTYIATAPMPWIDGFITWSKTEVSDNVKCCRYHRDSPSQFCPSNYGSSVKNDVVNITTEEKADDSMFSNYDHYYHDVDDKGRKKRQTDYDDYYGDYGDYYGDFGDFGGK